MELKAQGVTKEFIRESKGTNRFTAVDSTDLILSGGELTVLLGRSGSGKTTLLNMLAGLLTPTSGSITLDGQDIYSLPDKELSRLRNLHIGVIPQGQTAIHSLTVRENILLPYTLYGDLTGEATVYASELMEQLDIAHLASAKPSELSGGELRRMAIARAYIRKPEIILADEPTGDLDDENTRTVFEALRKAASDGAAVLAVTHESIAEEYADRVFRMNKGVIGSAAAER